MHHHLPDISSFLRVLQGGKANYVPLAELGVHPVIKAQFLNKHVINPEDEITFALKAGYDYVKLQPRVAMVPLALDTTAVKDDGTPDYHWASEGKGLITNEQELQDFPFPDPADIDYSSFEQFAELLPEGMGIIGQYGDIFTLTWQLMGFETFSYALFDNLPLVQAINERIGRLVLSMFEYMAQNDRVAVLWYSDDIAYGKGLLTAPQVLEQLFFPWLEKIGRLAREYNKPLIFHSDGKLGDVMDRLIACSISALHPIEPQAMDLSEVKKRYGDRLCLIGGIDVDLLARGNPEAIRQQVQENVRLAAYNGAYMIGSGNSIPDYVPLQNYLAMLNSAWKINGWV